MSKQDGMFSPAPYPDPYKQAQNSAMAAADESATLSARIHGTAGAFSTAIENYYAGLVSPKVAMVAREIARSEGLDPGRLTVEGAPWLFGDGMRGRGYRAAINPIEMQPTWYRFVADARAAIGALDKAREEEMRGGPDTDRDLDAMMFTLASMFRFGPDGDTAINSVTDKPFQTFQFGLKLNGKPLDCQSRRALIAELFSDILKSADGASTICWRKRPSLGIDGDEAKLRCRLDFAP